MYLEVRTKKVCIKKECNETTIKENSGCVLIIIHLKSYIWNIFKDKDIICKLTQCIFNKKSKHKTYLAYFAIDNEYSCVPAVWEHYRLFMMMMTIDINYSQELKW